MENKMKNSELDKVSGGGDRIQQAEDGRWMIYPYSKRFSTEKEAEEYVNSIVNAQAQKNYELEKKLLDDLHIEEITSELDKISGGKERIVRKTFVETKDGKWVICHLGMQFDTKQEAFNFLHGEINGPDEPIKKSKDK